MAVELRQGSLRVTGSELWLDSTRKRDVSFVSHAHADHIARHNRVIATTATVSLMAHRLGALLDPMALPYNTPVRVGALDLELLPAGHILGSAQIRVTRPDGHRIVYTGDFNLSPSLTAEPAQVAECDTLVMESTFGHPRYVFPPKAEVLGAIEAWCRGLLERGITPVLLAYPLGKSQEAMKYLLGRGLRVRAHPDVARMTDCYRALGTEMGDVRAFEGEAGPDEVLVFPPRLSRSMAIGRLQRKGTAVLTGWAMDAGVARRYGADCAFPLSDHADFSQLCAYAKATGAREVITCHGHAEELAAALRHQGIVARAVGRALQLGLAL